MVRNLLLGFVLSLALVTSSQAESRCQLQKEAYREAVSEYKYQLRYEKALDKSVKKGDRNLQRYDYQIERVTARYDRMIDRAKKEKKFFETNFIVDCAFSGGDACAARLAKYFERLQQYDYKISNIRDRKELALEDLSSRKELYRQEVEDVRTELNKVRNVDLPPAKAKYESAKAAYENCLSSNQE